MRYETAIAPGAITDQSSLFGLDSSGRIIGLDHASGVGWASRLEHQYNGEPITTPYASVIASPFLFYGVGSVPKSKMSIYVNDAKVHESAGVESDADGDALGHKLELELGTCDRPSDPNCADPLKTPTTKDSDRDGLLDDWEVFGLEQEGLTGPGSGGLPGSGLGDLTWEVLNLPKWGASPLHKDAFFEMDWSHPDTLDENLKPVGGYLEQPIQPLDMLYWQIRWAVGSAADLGNRDGANGVALHFDVGYESPAICNSGTLCGSWGGATMLPASFAMNDASRTTPFHLKVFRSMRTSRDGGQSPVPSRGFNYGYGSGPNTFTHEMGHSMNLEHWGYKMTGVAECKPNYASVMNYANSAFGPVGEFSSALSPWNIDSSAARETLATPITAPWLVASPYLFNFTPSTGPITNVDWSRDGQRNTGGSTPLRVPVAWGPGGGCAAFEGNAQWLSTSNPKFTSTPDPQLPAQKPRLVRFNNQMYAFYINANGNVVYRKGPLTGADDNGSCPPNVLGHAIRNLGSYTDNACTTFDAAQVASTKLTDSFAAIEWNGQIYLAIREPSGKLWVMNSTGSTGSALTWVTKPQLSSNSGAVAPEFAELRVAAAKYGSATRVLSLTYKHSVTLTLHQFTLRAVGGSWVYDGALTTGTVGAIDALSDFGVINWPGRESALAASLGTCLASTRYVDGRIQFYCYDTATDRWTDLGVIGANKLARNVSLAFHRVRTSTGAMLNANEGQFWLHFAPLEPDPTSGVLTRRTEVLFVGPTVSVSSPPTAGWVGSWGVAGNGWQSNNGVGYYEDAITSSLKALRVDAGGTAGSTLVFMPFADGGGKNLFKDVNDFQVMERGVCLGISPARPPGDPSPSICGTINQWGY